MVISSTIDMCTVFIPAMIIGLARIPVFISTVLYEQDKYIGIYK